MKFHSNAAKKAVTMLIAATMLLGCFATFCFSASAATKTDIVRDGLVVWYDGSNNSNGTQNLEAAVWTDLTGNGNDLTVHLDEKNYWTDNAFHVDSKAHYFPQTAVDTVNAEGWTVEFAFGELAYNGIDYVTFAMSDNDKFSLFIRQSDGKLEFKYQNRAENRPLAEDGGALSNNATLSIVYYPLNEENVYPIIMYVNGVEAARGHSTLANQADTLMFCHEDPSRSWSGDIHSVRFYNRALSADEILDNADADQKNYRSGNKFEPTVEFGGDGEDTQPDDGQQPVVRPEYKNDLIPLDSLSNVMEWNMAYAENVYFHEENQNFARFQVTNPTIDNPANYTQPGEEAFPEININYQKFARMNGLENLTGEDVNYVVLKLKVSGPIEDINMWTCVGEIYDYYRGAYSTGSIYGGVDPDAGSEIQYLIYDVEGIFEGDLNSFLLTPGGWDETTVLDLYELAIFKTAEEAYDYAGEEYVEETDPPVKETEPKVDETDAPKADETDAPKTEDTDAPKTEETAPKTEETEATTGGCSSVVGFGAVAILTAAAAAVVLKKKD